MSDNSIRKLEEERGSALVLHVQPNASNQPDPEKEWAKVMRKLSFKMPQTFKYSVIGFSLLGIITCILQKKASRIFLYPLIGTPTVGLGLCYNDFYRMYEIKFLMKPLPAANQVQETK